MSKLMILDGNNILLRSIFAPREHEMYRSDGLNTTTLHRCLNTIFKQIKIVRPTHFLCVFDHGQSEYRTQIRPEYKANRKEGDEEAKRERLENMLHELSLLQESLTDMYMTYLSSPRVEADDIIASICEHYAGEKVVVSEDHDLLQLVDHSTVIQKLKRRKDEQHPATYTIGKVRERYGVSPSELPYIWALAGDKGDNIEGLRGVGEKRAQKAFLANNNDFLDTVEALAKTEEDHNRVVENLDLIQLHAELFTELPLLEGIELDYDFLKHDINTLSEKHEFKSFLFRLSNLV